MGARDRRRGEPDDRSSGASRSTASRNCRLGRALLSPAPDEVGLACGFVHGTPGPSTGRFRRWVVKEPTVSTVVATHRSPFVGPRGYLADETAVRAAKGTRGAPLDGIVH